MKKLNKKKDMHRLFFCIVIITGSFIISCKKDKSDLGKTTVLIEHIEIVTELHDLSEGHTAYSNYDGKPVQMGVRIEPEDATNKKIKWRVSDTTIAQIDSSGLLTGKYPGSFYAYAETTDGSNLVDSFYIRLRGKNGFYYKNSFYKTDFATYQILSGDLALIIFHPESVELNNINSTNKCEWTGDGDYLSVYFQHYGSQFFDEGSFSTNLRYIIFNVNNKKEKIVLQQENYNRLISVISSGKYNIDYMFSFTDTTDDNTIQIKGYYYGSVISNHDCECINCN